MQSRRCRIDSEFRRDSVAAFQDEQGRGSDARHFRPTGFHLLEATIDDIHTAFRSVRMTCRELVGLYLKRISAYDKSRPGLNAVLTINPRSLQEADRLDAFPGLRTTRRPTLHSSSRKDQLELRQRQR